VVQKNSHCSYCGQPFDVHQRWPRLCASCGSTSVLNPLPVSVGLLPVDDGLLIMRRNIKPQIGRLALPGGTRLLFLGVAPATRAQDLPPCVPNEEAQGICVLAAPQEPAFSTHTETLQEYFAG